MARFWRLNGQAKYRTNVKVPFSDVPLPTHGSLTTSFFAIDNDALPEILLITNVDDLSTICCC